MTSREQLLEEIAVLNEIIAQYYVIQEALTIQKNDKEVKLGKLNQEEAKK